MVVLSPSTAACLISRDSLGDLLLLGAQSHVVLGGDVRVLVPEQLVQGCRIDDGACVCGLGCDTSFRYSTRDQCQTALKMALEVSVMASDGLEVEVSHGPQMALEIVRDPGYQCLCVNTGYYGHVCHKKCPTPEEFNNMDPSTQFPIECMLI
ncbi:hypothetical protein Hamer_G018624 [Homarus americanus]|uniref:Uncharacterized protein n=1 Tax=Homarus americanus TaxID=6706 RepID=A0A8J5N1I9_HOMAM|nr:hypothetical protein Hamer_G018624 [Homarus americanus]